jgi:hypothetical protein
MNDVNGMHDQDQGSFLTGFTVGLFAGAAGYFLFGTDRGEKVRSTLQDEWEEAKDKLVDQGVIRDKSVTLREVVRETVSRAARSAGVVEVVGKTKKSSKAASKKSAAKSKTSTAKSKVSAVKSLPKQASKKFKGV